jgi:translocation and assembly module TamA
LRLGRTQDTQRFERLYFAELLQSRQSLLADGSVVDAQALSANYQLVWRELDSVVLPTRGFSVSLQGGAGQAQSNAGRAGPFGRLYGRLTGYLPLGAQWYGQARVEAGEVIKSDAVVVPDALGFRAGGDDSVRGYGYRTLTPNVRGQIVSGNVLLTTSVELARPIMASMPSVWGAVFVDAGRAAQRWADYAPALGYGVGVRWRSPIGPLRADLAWGQELRKLRLHLSVGIAF